MNQPKRFSLPCGGKNAKIQKIAEKETKKAALHSEIY